MKKIILLFLCICFHVNGQNRDEAFIDRVRAEINQSDNLRQERLDVYFQNNPDVKRKILDNDHVSIAYDVMDGQLLYRTNFNVNASEATRTDFLKQGSSLNLDLEGNNLNIGLWEVGGSPLVSHIEFDNNGTSRIIISDGVSNQTTFHATHVAGTLAAKGVNLNVKGMASESTILAFDAVNDQDEALNQSTNNNLLISNHSYGVPVSSDNGTSPASLMGTYNSSARNWDLIAEASPFYLSVFAAGNDGGTFYNGGSLSGFDKLTGEKNSKNNLVVANASSVFLDNSGSGEFITAILNSSSSQGPSDDGRIKPDITGLGTNIFSTSDSGINSYGTLTGTSMSAPNVSGSLLLLQELYFNLKNSYMRASTLKAVSLITADDSGNVGPDAIFGWGVLNSKKAAETIIADNNSQNALINESILNDGQQISFDVVSNGTEPLKVGVVWTDPAGFVQTTTNSTIPALVNDIDIKLIDNNGVEFFPWRLNQSNFAGSAQKGVNSVDNVEIVEVEFPSNSTYTVIINHKNNLSTSFQNISIVATGIVSHNLSIDRTEKVDFVIWPNPVENTLYIKTKGIFPNANYKIFDLNGRSIITGVLSNSNSIDLSNLLQGVYVLKLISEKSILTKKIIKN